MYLCVAMAAPAGCEVVCVGIAAHEGAGHNPSRGTRLIVAASSFF